MKASFLRTDAGLCCVRWMSIINRTACLCWSGAYCSEWGGGAWIKCIQREKQGGCAAVTFGEDLTVACASGHLTKDKAGWVNVRFLIFFPLPIFFHHPCSWFSVLVSLTGRRKKQPVDVAQVEGSLLSSEENQHNIERSWKLIRGWRLEAGSGMPESTNEPSGDVVV